MNNSSETNGKLDAAYSAMVATPSDINELLPVLHHYGSLSAHITEMGTRSGVSTVSFLHTRPRKLIAYDIKRSPEVAQNLNELAIEAGVAFEFIQADTRLVHIEPTDLLFIDTWHVYEQLRIELFRHAAQVRRYIVMHDTVSFGELGETQGHRGLWPAIIEFLQMHPEWFLVEQYIRSNGLTVLAQRSAGRF
jgi:predicted O-methyltransferase YrrM